MATASGTSPAAAQAGVIVSALTVALLLADGAVGVVAPQLLAKEMAATGFAPALLLPVSLLVIACAAVYAAPATRTLGAVLITGYFGGAVCTHVRVGGALSPPVFVCIALAGLAWLGLWLRDARVRALLPLTRG